MYSSIVGDCLHANAPSIEWPSGHRTAAPFLPDEEGQNILINEEYYTRRLALVATHVQHGQSQLVRCLDKHVDKNLRDQTADALSKGMCVLVRNAFDVSDFELTAEHLRDNYGIAPWASFDFHGMVYTHYPFITLNYVTDMEQRVTNWEAPHQKWPLSNFFESLHDPTKIQFILSCQLQQHAWFPPYRYVIPQYLTQCKDIIPHTVLKTMA